MKKEAKSLLTGDTGVVHYSHQTRQASVLRDTLNSGGFLFFLLTHNSVVVRYPQQTCQASVLRGMLKLGRSLFFQGVAL